LVCINDIILQSEIIESKTMQYSSWKINAIWVIVTNVNFYFCKNKVVGTDVFVVVIPDSRFMHYAVVVGKI